MSEQAQVYASLPWIPNDEKRAKYEEKDDRVAIAENPIEGVVSGHGTRDRFDKKGKYNVVTITTDDGREVAIHCQPTVLENEMLEALPKYGERITVAYHGEKQGTNFATPYAVYSVKVHREAGGDIAWTSREGEVEPVRTNAAGQDAPLRAAPAASTPAPTPEQVAASTGDDEIPFAFLDMWGRVSPTMERWDPWRR